MPSQAELHHKLRSATDADERRDSALQLLARTNSRQYLDECLRALNSELVRATLDEQHRGILREKCLDFYAESKRDKAGLLREGLTRLLVHIEHPDDADIYKLGVATYYLQPVERCGAEFAGGGAGGFGADRPAAGLPLRGPLPGRNAHLRLQLRAGYDGD